MTNQEKINEAIKYLKGLNLESLEVGKYPVNDDFYYSIQEYDSKMIENCKLESHQIYADIQIVIKGEEAIDIAPIAELENVTEYNPEKDVAFWKNSDVMERIELKNGSYAVFLPRTAHKPGIAIDNNPSKVKKCVGKVRLS